MVIPKALRETQLILHIIELEPVVWTYVASRMQPNKIFYSPIPKIIPLKHNEIALSSNLRAMVVSNFGWDTFYENFPNRAEMFEILPFC